MSRPRPSGPRGPSFAMLLCSPRPQHPRARRGQLLRGLGGASQTGDLPSTASPRDPHRSRGDATAGLKSGTPSLPIRTVVTARCLRSSSVRMSPPAPATQPLRRADEAQGIEGLGRRRRSAPAAWSRWRRRRSCWMMVEPTYRTGRSVNGSTSMPAVADRPAVRRVAEGYVGEVHGVVQRPELLSDPRPGLAAVRRVPDRRAVVVGAHGDGVLGAGAGDAGQRGVVCVAARVRVVVELLRPGGAAVARVHDHEGVVALVGPLRLTDRPAVAGHRRRRRR